MTAGEKTEAKTEQAAGKAKEALGSAAGNDRMAAEGQAEKTTGDAREAKEKAKDAFRH
ncbi:CsbD family protein [Streptomyces sp. NPDC014991]|uniref:CsbD family protein n=1 Tax=Streptomyces sp. NPDC014991 TaxID=3364935 RepID=UPI0036FDDF9C